MALLEIKDLWVSVNEQPILKGINLVVQPGEVHAIMGPNGSGKSTLAHVIAGRDGYEVTRGDILLDGESVLDMPVEERAHRGVFLGFQYPVELPGVNNMYFLRAALNAHLAAAGKSEVDPGDFLELVRAKAATLKMEPKFLERSVNEGFSGGEKKRNEILQMLVLEPKLAILDETDSGLDIDALRIVADGVSTARNSERGIVLVTHYQRLLDYIRPDHVHVLADGQVMKSGDSSLAVALEERGYGWVTQDAAEAYGP